MKYKFYLNLDVYEDTTDIKIKPVSINNLEATDLVQLLSQFAILLVMVQRTLNNRDKHEDNDDIPF